MQCSHKELSVFVSIFMLWHIICFNYFLLKDNNQLYNKAKLSENDIMFGLTAYNVQSDFCFTSSTFLEETRSSANCRVFLRTSKSGVLNTLRMSITRSWKRTKIIYNYYQYFWSQEENLNCRIEASVMTLILWSIIKSLLLDKTDNLSCLM